jgi:hypothetical protein
MVLKLAETLHFFEHFSGSTRVSGHDIGPYAWDLVISLIASPNLLKENLSHHHIHSEIVVDRSFIFVHCVNIGRKLLVKDVFTDCDGNADIFHEDPKTWVKLH